MLSNVLLSRHNILDHEFKAKLDMLQENFFDPNRQNIQEFLMKPRKCDGCAVTLQFFDENESGFIDYQIFKSFLENEILFSEKKKREVEELVFDRSLLNRHMKLPSKKFLKVNP